MRLPAKLLFEKELTISRLVAVVDDDRDMREALAALVEVLGFEARASGEFNSRRFASSVQYGTGIFTQDVSSSFSYHRLFGVTVGPRIGYRADDWLFYTHVGAGADRYRQSWTATNRSFFQPPLNLAESRDEWVPTVIGAIGVERSGGSLFLHAEALMTHSL